MMDDSIPHLIVPGGEFVLDPAWLEQLGALENADRVAYRNANAGAIASLDASHLVIAAGPGTGKSHLFMSRILYWLDGRPGSRIHVATFVRKLVTDLETDVATRLDEDKRQFVTASTLHSLARRFIELGVHETSLGFRPNVRVLAGGRWPAMVWEDALAFDPAWDQGVHSHHSYLAQLSSGEYILTADWEAVREIATTLSRFYNAVRFSEMVTEATRVLDERPDLNDVEFWIIDEYQDFNPSEDKLVRQMTANCAGVLRAGDDDQALYQSLKGATPDIIIEHFRNSDVGKAMLPYCGRCSYHVCSVASAFIERHRDGTGIPKLFLPLTVDERSASVRVVATTTPQLIVGYLRDFMAAHRDEYEEYLARRAEGDDKDPFLLILSPTRTLTMRGGSAADHELDEFLAEYREAGSTWSLDYARTLSYATAGWHHDDNLAVRKLLDLEDMSTEAVHPFIRRAIDNQTTLAEELEREGNPALNRADEVCRVIELELVGEDTARRLADLIEISDPGALGDELDARPVRPQSARQTEDEADLDTARLLPPVDFMTMVGSKGLSAHHVVVVGCDDMNMERTTALAFFVAITRARSSLHLVMARNMGGTDLHRFVYDLPEEHCKYLKFANGPEITMLDGRDDMRRMLAGWNSFRRR